eukprot:5400667-Pleurochrysis_carterae.AAC.8
MLTHVAMYLAYLVRITINGGPCQLQPIWAAGMQLGSDQSHGNSQHAATYHTWLAHHGTRLLNAT